MSVATAEPAFAASGSAPRGGTERDDDARAPLCFVIDADASIRHFLSLVLHGAGIDTEEFADGQSFRAAMSRRIPALVFLNIALEFADAIECVVALGKKGFRRIRTADEQPRLGGARARQEHRREATAADAGSAQEAVRDQRRAANPQRAAARASAGAGRSHRSRRGAAQ